MVHEFCYAGLAPQSPLTPTKQDKYVALASGLNLADCQINTINTQLLQDFLTGNLGGPPQQELSSKVAHLVIAGGTIGALEALGGNAPYGSRQQTAALQPIQ